jgi:hypothetical protein
MVVTEKAGWPAVLAEKWKLEAEARAYVEEKQLQPLVGDLMASLVRLRSLATPSTI